MRLMKMKNVFKLTLIATSAVLAGALLSACGSTSEQQSLDETTELTLYSGRSEEFIAPFLAQWETESGIKLNVRYGDSAELAAQILEEGENSPADLFLSQDAGSLGAVSQAGLFTELATSVASSIPIEYVAANRNWVGITGRLRVFAYNPDEIKTLPKSISELTDARYKGKLAIAPSNSSFQAFVTALINEKGEDFAESWLRALVENDVKIYPKNSAIVEAIDKAEVAIGLVNHYYLWEVSEALGRAINVKNGFFQAGDLGNLINVSGAGVLASSKKQSAAENLIDFLTSSEIQNKFVSDTHEYSLIKENVAPEGLPALSAIGKPKVDLDALKNIKAAQELLTKVGLL